MYETFKDVLLAVRQKYKGATKLSLDSDDTDTLQSCLYGPSLNGIGCAIGCLLPVELAERMDNAEIDGMNMQNISTLLQDPALAAEIHQYISPAIDTEGLSNLQRMHDTADSVDDFVEKLDRMIAEVRNA